MSISPANSSLSSTRRSMAERDAEHHQEAPVPTLVGVSCSPRAGLFHDLTVVERASAQVQWAPPWTTEPRKRRTRRSHGPRRGALIECVRPPPASTPLACARGSAYGLDAIGVPTSAPPCGGLEVRTAQGLRRHSIEVERREVLKGRLGARVGDSKGAQPCRRALRTTGPIRY